MFHVKHGVQYKRHQMKIGLFFGSFNPIHIGHLIVANTVLDLTGIEQVWFVISPQNPFKKKAGLLDELKRLVLVEQAIADNEHLLVRPQVSGSNTSSVLQLLSSQSTGVNSPSILSLLLRGLLSNMLKRCI